MAAKRHFAAMKTSSEIRDYCRGLVAESDRERYLWSLFAHADRQPAVWAVWAFNQEVAKIWDSVSEPALAEIRLQWWDEVLDEILDGKVREQPVIAALSALEGKDKLFPLLKEAISARRLELFTGGADIKGLREYAAGAGGALHKAAFLAEMPDAREASLSSASKIGEAWALMGLIRALPYYWQHNKDLGSEALADITRLPDPEKALTRLAPTIAAMKSSAADQLAQADTMKPELTRVERICYLPAVLVKLHMQALDKAEDNPFELPRFEISDFTKMRKLIWAAIVK
jgi:phytoene synthase